MLVRTLIGAAVGAVAGFACYKWIGCASGSCPLTSKPLISTLYGMVLGMLVANAGR